MSCSCMLLLRRPLGNDLHRNLCKRRWHQQHTGQLHMPCSCMLLLQRPLGSDPSRNFCKRRWHRQRTDQHHKFGNLTERFDSGTDLLCKRDIPSLQSRHRQSKSKRHYRTNQHCSWISKHYHRAKQNMKRFSKLHLQRSWKRRD